MNSKLLFLFLYLLIGKALASPWIEADDPYLRSNIQLLADAGVLSAPVNSFPLPWALIADDIKKAQPAKLPKHLKTAYYHIRFQLQRAEQNRFQAHLKTGGENSAAPADFGSTNHSQWGVFSSIEYVADHFALRVNAAYAQSHGDKAKFIDDGSYFAINYKTMSLNIGRIERWWGPSWQSTLTQGQSARPMPAIAFNYADINVPIINSLSIDSFVAIVDSNSAYKYKWANRISTRPIRWLELSANYTYHWDLREDWQTQIGSDENSRQQLAADFRISLPSILDTFQLGLYGQWQNDSLANIKDSFIIGFDLTGDLFNQQVRFITEYKKSNPGTNQWINWLTQIDQPGNESMLFGDTFSFGSYIQFTNDHALTFFFHQEKMDVSAQRVSMNYQLPLFLGQLNATFNYSNAHWEKSAYQGGLSWEYRF